MVQVQLVDPGRLPARVAAVAVHQRDETTYLLRDDLTTREAADWINALGRRSSGNGETTRGSTPTPQ